MLAVCVCTCSISITSELGGHVLKRLYVVILGLVGLASVQVAEPEIDSTTLTAFNTAVESGDASAIEGAASDLMHEAIGNPDDPNALIAAYEAALRLCYLDCATALPGAEFVLSFPDTGTHPIVADRELLLAVAAYSEASNGASRADLERALMNVPEPTLLSARSFLPLYTELAESGQLGRAARVAGAAVEHLRPVRTSVLQYYLHALEAYATTHFLDEPSVEAHEAIVRWNAEMKQLYEALDHEHAPEWLSANYWRSEAWDVAVGAYYRSVETRWETGADIGALTPEQSEMIREEYPLPERNSGDDGHENVSELPHCDGELVMAERVRFPHRQSYNGIVGSVIVRFKLDENGRAFDAEVLASVPAGSFDTSATDPIESWYWEPEEGVDVASCRLYRDNLIVPISFSFD